MKLMINILVLGIYIKKKLNVIKLLVFFSFVYNNVMKKSLNTVNNCRYLRVYIPYLLMLPI